MVNSWREMVQSRWKSRVGGHKEKGCTVMRQVTVVPIFWPRGHVGPGDVAHQCGTYAFIDHSRTLTTSLAIKHGVKLTDLMDNQCRSIKLRQRDTFCSIWQYALQTSYAWYCDYALEHTGTAYFSPNANKILTCVWIRYSKDYSLVCKYEIWK